MITIQGITSVCLLVLILLQIVVMIYLLYINHKRYQEDKAYYKRLAKQDEEIMNTFKTKVQNLSLEEVTEDEQRGPKTENKE